MRRFKTQRRGKKQFGYIFIIIVISTILFLLYFNENISPKILDIAAAKLEEISTLYIKQDIAPTNTDLEKLIITNQNSQNEITFVDVNMDYAYELMVEILSKIQNNILALENGNIANFQNNRELKNYKNNLYLSIPLGLSHAGLLFSNMGPKIPIKVSFFEHVLGTVETEVTGYGINNALIKIYMIVTLEQKLIIPYKEEKFTRDFEVLIGSIMVSGAVPNIYGGSLLNSSKVIEME